MTTRFRILAVLAAVLVVATACRRNPDTTVAGADAYLARHQVKEAIIEYRRALQLAPRRADVHYKLGKAYVEAADLEAAYASFSTAADLAESLADAQVQAG